jgi:hypothetical protein
MRASLQRSIPTAIEAGWLIAAALVPLALAHELWMAGFVEMPKVAVLRTVAALAALCRCRGGTPRRGSWWPPRRSLPRT